MRILVIVPEYPPYTIGGGGSVFYHLVTEYTKLGHTVTVFYGYFPAKSLFEKITKRRDNNTTFFQVPLFPTPKFLPQLFLRLPPSFASFFIFFQDLREFDVAHIHGFSFLFPDLFSLVLKMKNIPYILTIHGSPTSENQSFLFSWFWNLYKVTIGNIVLAAALEITTVSYFVKNNLPISAQKKTTVIGNGITKSDLAASKKSVTLRKRYSLSKETLVIISLGRISKMKGYQKIIQLLPSLKNAVYFIIGQDEGYKKSLEEEIKSLGVSRRVFFQPSLEKKLAISLLSQADIVAVPSLFEGFSLVTLEAMALGKVILTNNKSGVREVLKNYPKVIAITDKNIKEKFEAVNKKQISFPWEKYSYKTIAKSYLKVLEKVKK